MKSKVDTLTQAFQCGGTWGSELDPEGPNRRKDGRFVNLSADGSGNLSGRHRTDAGAERDIKSGLCVRPGGGGKQRITLLREDENFEYHYSGEITDLLGRFRADGTCRITRKRRDGDEEEDVEGSKLRPPQTDEQWVATRPPNV